MKRFLIENKAQLILFQNNMGFKKSICKDIGDTELFSANPLASILMITYNHEKYIAEAIEGVIKQKTSFKIELVVGEDCSTDSTRQICDDYASQYPDLIKLLPSEKTLGMQRNGMRTIEACTGRYIALCDGDDFWTDPLKLQKQVDFLEANPKFVLSVGGFIQHDVKKNKQELIITIPPTKNPTGSGYEFTLDEVRDFWITKTLTMVFRNDKKVLNQLYTYTYGRDTNLVYHLLKGGQKGFYFTEVMGVYRVHEGGVFSMKGEAARRMSQYRNYKELYEKNRDEFTRVRHFRFTLGLLNFDRFNRYPGNTRKNRMKLFFESLRLAKNMKEIRQVLSAFSSPRPH